MSRWAVTEIAHPGLRQYSGPDTPPCEKCLALVDQAITHAQATGSKGATFIDGPAGSSGPELHSVKVARAIMVLRR